MRFATLDQWLRWQESLHPSAIDLGLDRVRRTLQRLGWRAPRVPVITIGGTNGKGSCAALAASILRVAGYRVGVFSSPHLIRYQERITIDGEEISDASLMAAFERIDAARGEDTLTFFEFNTLAALLVFETAGLDALILEVGMGGRLDAVNVVDADVALVASVALDHCEWLGPDVESIGREKAGIFRPGRPAVFGARNPPHSIHDVAAQLDARLAVLGRDFDWTSSDAGWTWRGGAKVYADLPRPALVGAFQFDNAAAVLYALEQLQERLPLTRAAIERGLQTVQLAGRFQRFTGQVEWILDVAHNPAAAEALAAQLAADPASGRTYAVCGVLADKDVEALAAALSGCIDAWVVAGLSGGRALTPTQLSMRLRTGGANVVALAPDVEQACLAARSLARRDDRIVVFGSFLTVGAALQTLRASAIASSGLAG